MTTLHKTQKIASAKAVSRTEVNSSHTVADWVLPSVSEGVESNADASSDASTNYTLNIGKTAEGVINTENDHDWYKITLNAGQAYSFAAIGSGTTPLKNPLLALRDAAGNIVASDDDSGPADSASLTYTSTTSGTYYLDVSSVGGGLLWP
jgi:serralysin